MEAWQERTLVDVELGEGSVSFGLKGFGVDDDKLEAVVDGDEFP